LQILGFTEEPKSVKIRYKMVQHVSDLNQQSTEANFVPVGGGKEVLSAEFLVLS